MTDTEQTGTDLTGEQTTDVNADDHDADPGRAARAAGSAAQQIGGLARFRPRRRT